MRRTAIVAPKWASSDHDFPSVLARELEASGFRIVSAEVSLFRSHLAASRLVANLDSPVIFSINFHPILAKASLELRVPYVSWGEITPLWFPEFDFPRNELITCFEGDSAMVKHLCEANLRAHFLPVGFDEKTFFASDEAPLYGVTFVGNGLGHMSNGIESYAERSEQLAARLAETDPLRECALRNLAKIARELGQLKYRVFEEIEADLSGLVDEALLQLDLPLEVLGFMRRELLEQHGVIGAFASRQRVETLEALQTLGCLTIFGRGFEHTSLEGSVRGTLSYAQTREVFARSQICVHIHRFYMDGANDRLFNVLACRGFLLARHTEDLTKLFEPGVHLETYRTIDEAVDKARYYLAHEAERLKIAQAGYEKVRAYHGFSRHLRYILDEVGLTERCEAV